MENRILKYLSVVLLPFLLISCGKKDPVTEEDPTRTDGTAYRAYVVGFDSQIDSVFEYNGEIMVLGHYLPDDNGYKTDFCINTIDKDLKITKTTDLSEDVKTVDDVILYKDMLLLGQDGYVFEIDVNNGDLKKITDEQYTGYMRLIDLDDDYGIYDGKKIDLFNDAGSNGNIVLDDRSISFSCPAFINGNDIIVVEDNCPEIDYLKYSNGKLEKICSNDTVKFEYSGFMGRYYSTNRGIGKIDLETGKGIMMAEWNNIDVPPPRPNLYSEPEICVMNDDLFCELYDYSDGTSELIILKHDSDIDHSQKTYLSVGGYGVTDDYAIKLALYEYNTSQDKYRVVLDDFDDRYPYTNAIEAQEQRLKMIEDFEHGDAPDLFYGRDFDYRYWGKAGILSDMSPYITDDIENSLTPGIRDLMLRNDGCYQIFSSYALMGFYGKEEYFGADNEVDISKAASVAGSHDIPLYCELCSYDIVDMAIRYEVEETLGKGSVISSDQMKSILDYAYEFGVPTDYQKSLFASERSLEADAFLLVQLNMNNIYSYSYIKDIVGDKINYVGFPSYEGSAHVIDPHGSLGISASCKEKDAAWEFISLTLDEYVQRNIAIGGGLPVNARILDEYNQCAADHEAIKEHPEYSFMKAYDEVSVSDIEGFTAMIDSADTVATIDWGIFNIIFDEINSKYLQSRSNDMIADSLTDRYRLYIEENYK